MQGDGTVVKAGLDAIEEENEKINHEHTKTICR
jgi:hypothetical protein